MRCGGRTGVGVCTRGLGIEGPWWQRLVFGPVYAPVGTFLKFAPVCLSLQPSSEARWPVPDLPAAVTPQL